MGNLARLIKVFKAVWFPIQWRFLVGFWYQRKTFLWATLLVSTAIIFVIANQTWSLPQFHEYFSRFERGRTAFDPHQEQRLVIIGAGPTGLGAAYRLFQRGIMRTNTQVVILDQEKKPGGLAASYRDSNGFLWDNGGHVVFSHYKYFDRLLDHAVPSWNKHERNAYAFMKCSSGKRKYIPYPVQDNIPAMDEKEQQAIFKDLEQLINHPITKPPANFDEWLLKNFGQVLSDVFMRKYNRKVWTVDPKEMNAIWVGERVAVPDLKKMKSKNVTLKDSKWGPNRFFRFPRFHGTGGIWKAVSDLLPPSWLHFGHEVTRIKLENRTLDIKINGNSTDTYSLNFDILISTMPLDVLVNMDQNPKFNEKRSLANELVYSHTHIVGIGLKGQCPEHLSGKSWIYFPDSDSPFYRVTVFSKYSNDHVPQPTLQWSLMCECAEPKLSGNHTHWNEKNVVTETISALVEYGFITRDQVISRYYRRLSHGYPVPSISRERVLSVIQPWLESHRIYSRGRFGGWRYEVSNQDHSLMQGVEVADLIFKGIPEETYPGPSFVNSMKAADRSTKNQGFNSLVPDYEIILSHYDEDLTWILKEANHCHVYHKGKMVIPDWRFKQWEILPNVGRESHTYLHHIITNYDRLANVTVFYQGGANDHPNSTYNDTRIYVEEAKRKGFSAKLNLPFNFTGRLIHRNKFKLALESGRLKRSSFTLGEFWKEAFGTKPRTIVWCPKGNFAVTRELIHKKPVKYYKKLISYIDNHSDPEEGHYFERLWRVVFGAF